MQGNVKETWEEELRCLLIISCEQVSHEMAHVPLSGFSNFPIRAILTVSNFKSAVRFLGKSYNNKKLVWNHFVLKFQIGGENVEKVLMVIWFGETTGLTNFAFAFWVCFRSVFGLKGLFLFQFWHKTGDKELYWMVSASRKLSLLPQQRMALCLLIFICRKFTQLQYLTQNRYITTKNIY